MDSHLTCSTLFPPEDVSLEHFQSNFQDIEDNEPDAVLSSLMMLCEAT